MVEADIASLTGVDVVLEVLTGCIAPCVGRVVELQDEVVGGNLALRNLFCRVEDGEIHVEPFLVVFEPLETSCGETFVESATLSEYQYAA